MKWRIKRKEHKAMKKKIFRLSAIVHKGHSFRLSSGKKISKCLLILLMRMNCAKAVVNSTSQPIFVVKMKHKHYLRTAGNNVAKDNIASLPIEKVLPVELKTKIWNFLTFRSNPWVLFFGWLLIGLLVGATQIPYFFL